MDTITPAVVYGYCRTEQTAKLLYQNALIDPPEGDKKGWSAFARQLELIARGRHDNFADPAMIVVNSVTGYKKPVIISYQKLYRKSRFGAEWVIVEGNKNHYFNGRIMQKKTIKIREMKDWYQYTEEKG